MKPQHVATLGRLLACHITLGKSRMETLVMLMTAMIGARTVNLSHLASERVSTVLVTSTYRRFQRFFAQVQLSQDWAAGLIVSLSGIRSPWYLCLDRTNWKVGQSEVNILLLAVTTRRFRVPLLWTVLDRAGTSNTGERVALMRRYLALFGASSVRLLLADREFIGLKWLIFLDRADIPFAIRVKDNQFVLTEDGRYVQLKSLMRRTRCRLQIKAAFIAGDDRLNCHIQARRIKGGEALIIISNDAKAKSLKAYRKRWAIECLFADAKSRGFNLEDTRLTIATRLHLLIALTALATAWACRTATQLMGNQAPPKKNHGYLSKSWFRVGFDELRRLLKLNPEQAISSWQVVHKKCCVV